MLREGKQTPPHEYYVNLARSSPRVSTNELTPFERDHGHEQFGNNFLLLFVARQQKELNPESESVLVEIYLNRAEAQGDKWQQFLGKNQKLIHELDQGLDGLKPYSELLEHFQDLLLEGRKTGNYSVSEEFEALDIESVGIYAWRKLNPLLKEAAEQMRKVGINPKEFFG